MLEIAFYILISLILLKIILPLSLIIFNYTIGKSLFSKAKSLKKAGEWAIVTGATDGIGKEYAKQLAKQGLNIMLISRSEEKLRKTAEEISASYGVKTSIVVADFSKTDVYEPIQEAVSKLSSVACLVNNVGMSYPYMDKFWDSNFIDLEFIRKMISCNMCSTASMTRIVLPRLLEQRSKHTAIINLGSFAGYVSSPFLSLYGASKSFVHHFSNSLRNELAGTKVLVQAVFPLLVATSMSKIKRPSYFKPNANTYVSSALAMLGVESLTSGYLGHALQTFVVNLLPESFIRWTHSNKMKAAHKKFKKA